ncbi:homeobox-DDT domain protein RLT1 [Trifolium repens]|nr:homeobox-DDT domain protein RLT1 [Trifolium repens]
MDKNNKRKLKTPAQLMALEDFYNDHKYPTEEMKLELANELALTEKQISGWFCHRRLKDKRLMKGEVCANGRQDRSSGIVQDHGSGRQDSCGSTKHDDYRSIVGLPTSFTLQAHWTGLKREGVSIFVTNTSSESSSSLQERLFLQGQDPYDTEPSRYVTPIGSLPPLNPKGYKPSGYLKMKGEIEHAAITAVKNRLGRNYLEDGPLLNIDFDTIPPGAFVFQTTNPVNEPYHVANPSLSSSPEVSAAKRQHSLNSKYDSNLNKSSSQDLHMEGSDFGSLHDSDFQDKKSRQHKKQRTNIQGRAIRTNHLHGKSFFPDLYVDSTREAPAYDSTRNHRIGTKHVVERMSSDSASSPSDTEENNPAVKPANPLLHDYTNSNVKNIQRSEYVKSKPSNSIRNSQISEDTGGRGLSERMEEKFNGGRKIKKQYHESDGVRMPSKETMVAKRAKVYLLHQYDIKQAHVAEIEPRKTQRSAVEMPSSISEDDEIAETSSSLD